MIFKKGNKVWLGKKHTEETKKKISEAHKGQYPSEETKKKLREARKGKKPGYRIGKIKTKCALPNCNKSFEVWPCRKKENNFCCNEHANLYMKGKHNPNWRGKSKRTNTQGYILIRIKRGNPFFSMIKGNESKIPEHRLIIAKHLGRCLESWEQVHHKNGIKADNRIENLELVKNVEHSGFHRQVTALKKEVKELRGLLLMATLAKETNDL